MPKIYVVCCDASDEKLSQIVEFDLESSELAERTLESLEQDVPAGEEKGMHNAAHHVEHGAVTYLQEVREGGFSVFVGEPSSLRETFFQAGQFVAFMDDDGPGHASKVGPDGVRRTLRVLKGHLGV